MTLDETIRACQRKVNVEDDGEPGPQTWNAIAKALGAEPSPAPVVTPAQPAPSGSSASWVLDSRSETNVATLVPKAQAAAREFIVVLNDKLRAISPDLVARIISGTRTYAEQDALYAQGRTAPGQRVTNARAGYSNHNFGIAWDIGIFQGGKYLDESPHYDLAGQVGNSLGLQWGGDWKTIVDKPHFELKTGLSLAEMRARKERVEAIV